MAALEAAALNGSLFQPRSTSPTRSSSTASPQNTDDELASDHSPPSSPSVLPQSNGGAQTGPKGVINDQRARTLHDKSESERVRRETIRIQEKRGIVAQTSVEEERNRKVAEKEVEEEEEEVKRRWRSSRITEIDGERKRGGLREVGKEGFVSAVERPGWVVVLIYEPGIPRCQTLLASMLSLSLSLPAESLPTPLLLLRARAISLSFSLLSHQNDASYLQDIGYDQNHDDDDFDVPSPKGRPDPDVLPTILAYKNGELEKTWIRADWEVDEGGVEGLLRREGILPGVNRLRLGHRASSDEDD